MIPTEDIIPIVKNTIAASIKCNTHRGYIGWSSCDNICMDMHDCLDMCAETLEKRGYMVALEAASYILVSGVKLASHADSSSGMLTDVIMCTYELIDKCTKEIEKKDKQMRDQALALIIKEAKKRVFDGWTDWRYNLLKSGISVISNEALQTFNDEKVRKALEYLGEYPYTRIGADYLNIYENVVMNILKHRSQELLLKKVLKNNLDSDNAGQIVTAYWIYVVMLYSALVKKDKDLQGNGGKVIEMGSITVMESGFALRTAILSSKGAKDDECIKGTIYQLLNALSTRNTGKFLDIVMRLYCTCKVPAEVGQADKLVIPREFVYIQKNQELFEEYGYAFVLGLKGCRQNKKNEEVI